MFSKQISQKLWVCSLTCFETILKEFGFIKEEDALFPIREVNREANRASWTCKSSAYLASDIGSADMVSDGGAMSPLFSWMNAESENHKQTDKSLLKCQDDILVSTWWGVWRGGYEVP